MHTDIFNIQKWWGILPSSSEEMINISFISKYLNHF